MAAIGATIFHAEGLEYPPGQYGPDGPCAVIWVDLNNRFSTHVSVGPAARPYWNESLEIPWLDPVDGDTTLFIDIVHASAGEDTMILIASTRLKLKKLLPYAGSGQRVNRTLTLDQTSGRRGGKVYVGLTVLHPRRYDLPGAYYVPNGAHYPPPPSDGQPSFWKRIAAQLGVNMAGKALYEMLTGCWGDNVDGDYFSLG